jgi:hypothetical protein
MMVNAAELEEIIALTPVGERVVNDGREIGSALITSLAKARPRRPANN